MVDRKQNPRAGCNRAGAYLGDLGNTVPTAKVNPPSAEGKTMALRGLALTVLFCISGAAVVANMPAGGAA